MTDKNEAASDSEQASVESAELVATAEIVEGASARGEKKSRWWVILIIIVISFFAGAGAIGYYGWLQLATLKTDLANLEAATRAQVASLAVDQENAHKVLIDDVESRVARIDTRVRNFGGTVDSLSTLVVEATQSDDDGLVIAEVDYLLQLASNRIGLEQNREGALLAINRAQSRLETLSAGAYQPILEQIAADKAALEAVVTPDVGAVVKTLTTLLDQVDELGTESEKNIPQGETPSAEDKQASGWGAFVSGIGENLSQFVEVNRVDGAAPPIVIPNQEFFARENLRISLQNARASAVRRDTSNFRLALAEAVVWLDGHFRSSAHTIDMQVEIDRLTSLDLAPALPTLDGSLNLIRQLSKAPQVTEETPAEAVIETTQEVPTEAVIETTEDVPTETVIETTEEVLTEAVIETIEDVPAPTAAEMVEEVLEEVGESAEEGVDNLEEETQ